MPGQKYSPPAKESISIKKADIGQPFILEPIRSVKISYATSTTHLPILTGTALPISL